MISKESLSHLIDAKRNEHLAFLQRLIRAPSPNPPGDTRDANESVQDHLSTCGISAEIIAPKSEAPNLVCMAHGGIQGNGQQRNLVLNGHIDHFPVNDSDQWQRDPYSGDIEDGSIHGRGAVDMKAGTAASIIAFTYIHRFKEQLSGQCTLEVVSDEETGGKYGTKYLVDQHMQ